MGGSTWNNYLRTCHEPENPYIDKPLLRIVERDSDEKWQRKGEHRWHEQPELELALPPACEPWHHGEIEARRHIAAGEGDVREWHDALREAISERDAIEAEVAEITREHAEIDALATNLPALRVPPEEQPLSRIAWLIRRWWRRIGERRRARKAEDLDPVVIYSYGIGYFEHRSKSTKAPCTKK